MAFGFRGRAGAGFEMVSAESDSSVRATRVGELSAGRTLRLGSGQAASVPTRSVMVSAVAGEGARATLDSSREVEKPAGMPVAFSEELSIHWLRAAQMLRR
jgi:hypothetical protein